MGAGNVVSGVQFGRKRVAKAASPPDSPSSALEEAVELLLEGTGVLADALSTLAANAPHDARAQALRLRCEVLTRLVEDQVGALAGLRAPLEDTIGADTGDPGTPTDPSATRRADDHAD